MAFLWTHVIKKLLPNSLLLQSFSHIHAVLYKSELFTAEFVLNHNQKDTQTYRPAMTNSRP